MEKEFKWTAAARGSFARFEAALRAQAGGLSAPENLSITDYYLDDPSGALSRRKIALRIRRTGRRYEATCKSRTRLKNGLACRAEHTLLLPQVRSLGGALKALQAKKIWQGISLADLRVRFVLRNRRKVYTLHYRRAVCEAALDRYVITAGARDLAQREIELELKQGCGRDFEKLVQELTAASGLKAAEISKVASAEKLLQNKN